MDAELCVTGQGIFPRIKWDLAILEKLPWTAMRWAWSRSSEGSPSARRSVEVIKDAVQAVAFLDGQLPESISNTFRLRLETAAMIWKYVLHSAAFADAEKRLLFLSLPC